MSTSLQLNSQKWQLAGCDGLRLFLPRLHSEQSIYYHTEWSFAPAEANAASPKLRLKIIGRVPGLRDWRALENLYLGYHDRLGEKEVEEARGPDMWLWLPGETKPFRFGNWETNLKFGQRQGNEFDFSLDALCRSERASQFMIQLHMKQFFQQPVPPDWEMPDWINEGDQLSFEGRFELREILCSTPLNTPKPLELAKQMARRELAVQQFGTCILTDSDHPHSHYKPQDGICDTGRLVVLPMLAD